VKYSRSANLLWSPPLFHLQDRIRAQHRELLRLAQRVYPVPRLIEFLSQGLSSKNSRTRVECTEVLCDILAIEGLSVFERSKEKPFPAVAQARTSTILIKFCSWPGWVT